MQINSVNNSSAFGARFSHELANKAMACGKVLLKKGKMNEYAEYADDIRSIKKLFPDAILKLKPVTEYVDRSVGSTVESFPVNGYKIFMERFAERDFEVLSDFFTSKSLVLSKKQIEFIQRNLSRYYRSMINKGYDEAVDVQRNSMLRELFA